MPSFKTISAIEAKMESLGYPAWIINNNEIKLCYGQWVIDDENQYIPCIVNGEPKLMCLMTDIDCDGRSYSYAFTDEVKNGEFGKEVDNSDYLQVAVHLSYCI